MQKKICHLVGAGDFCGFNAEILPDDIVIAVDGGYRVLEKAGITPDFVVGDFDSLGYVPKGDGVQVHPKQKDDTDMVLAAGAELKLNATGLADAGATNLELRSLSGAGAVKLNGSTLTLKTVEGSAYYEEYMDENGKAYMTSQVYVSKLGNKSLKWEKTAAYNIGLDYSLLDGAVDGSIDFYKSTTTDLLVSRTLPKITGFDDIHIGDTLCSPDNPEPIPFQKISEPTLSMNFIVNDSPFAGQEGKFVTSRNIRDRLFKEVETNVSMRVEETESTDTFKVSGRGELHLSILIETMRRQGYEFQVSRPKVITKVENGKLLEPMELLIVEVPEEYVGAVMMKIGARRGELENMGTRDGGATHLEFKIPARGLIGYRSEFMTDTNGNGIMNNLFAGYEEYKGEIETRERGSIVAHETGESTAYGLFNTQDRGRLFIGPGVPVYEGMIVGECAKNEDLTCNICKTKHLTNTRASGSDDALRLVPHTVLSLEQSMEFIKDDELMEVTPVSIRLRKTILSKDLRLKQQFKKK